MRSIQVVILGSMVAAAIVLGVVLLGSQAFLLGTRVAPGDPTIEITDAAGVPISQLRKQKPNATIELSLPRKKEQNIPVAIRTRNHRDATYTVQLLDLRKKPPQEIARATDALSTEGKFVVQLQPTVSPTLLESGSHHELRAVLTVATEKRSRSARAAVPLTVRWSGSLPPRSGERPAEIAGIGDTGIPRPNQREDTTGVSLPRTICGFPATIRILAPRVSYTLFFQRQKDDGKFATVADASGTTEQADAHQVTLRMRDIPVIERYVPPGQPVQELVDRLPNGAYRLVLNAKNLADPKKGNIRDEVLLSATFNDPFNSYTNPYSCPSL